MTLPRKGTRSIVVDGVAYRWMVTAADDRYPGFVATLAGQPRCELLWTRYGGEPEIIAPGFVAAGIRAARHEGWLPDEPGPPFTMLNGERIGAQKRKYHAAKQ